MGIKLRPLNDVLIIKPDPIMKHEGLIVLPDKNAEEKRSPFATVVSWGSKCNYRFHSGQRIIFDNFRDEANYFIFEGEQYRFIHEHYVQAVCE